MSREEVQKLSDDDLKSAWNEVKACIGNKGLKDSLSEMAKNILFVDFIMTPIQKAKEIIKSYCRHIYLEGNEKYYG